MHGKAASTCPEDTAFMSTGLGWGLQGLFASLATPNALFFHCNRSVGIVHCVVYLACRRAYQEVAERGVADFHDVEYFSSFG